MNEMLKCRNILQCSAQFTFTMYIHYTYIQYKYQIQSKVIYQTVKALNKNKYNE